MDRFRRSRALCGGLRWVQVAWMVAALASCGREPSPAGPGQRGDSDAGYGSTEVPSGGVARLTPEQLSASFIRSLGTDYSYDDGAGNASSYITTDLAVPLGGVDFLGRVRDRDSLTKVQTLLVARGIAWPLALKIVQREVDEPGAKGSLFTRCKFVEDHPSSDEAGRARWEEQLQEFYMRLLSRPATADEVELVGTTFEGVYEREQNTASAWLVTLYALLSSMETWHTWR